METMASIMSDVPAPPKWFLAEELAERWQVKLRRIKRLRQQGQLPIMQFGERDYRFPVDKILELEKNGIFFQRIKQAEARPAAKRVGVRSIRRKGSKKK